MYSNSAGINSDPDILKTCRFAGRPGAIDEIINGNNNAGDTGFLSRNAYPRTCG